jgi:hypothetical protein
MPPRRDKADLPHYANRAGDPAFPPPYTVDEAGLDIFILEADRASLQRVVEQALNFPTDRFYRRIESSRRYRGPYATVQNYTVEQPYIGLACLDVLKFESTGKDVVKPGGFENSNIYARQKELAVMVPIVDGAGRRFWYLPYVLNGLPTAIVTGRELYGYPKQFASFEPSYRCDVKLRRRVRSVLRIISRGEPDRPTTIFGPRRDWCRLAVQAYDLQPDAHRDLEFCSIPVVTFEHRPLWRSLWRSLLEWLGCKKPPRDIAGTPQPGDLDILPGGDAPGTERHRLVAQDARVGVASKGVAAWFLERIESDVPYLFLRQFRDPEGEKKASYQAVVAGRLVPGSKHSLCSVACDLELRFPWAFNLNMTGTLFGKLVKENQQLRKEVCGLLTGENVAFDVLQASIVWETQYAVRPEPAIVFVGQAIP